MITTSKNLLSGTRFGAIPYTDEEVLSFPQGIVGFPNLRRFILVKTSETSAFRWLQSVEYPEMAFLVTDPAQFAQDYRPVKEESEGTLLATVNIPHGRPEEMTLNLAGPIWIEHGTRRGYQMVLDSEAYTTKYRVFAKASSEIAQMAA